MNFHEHINDQGEVLILKRIPQSRITNGGGNARDLLWPGVGGVVECDTWKPDNNCGGGIHGWPWGFGLGDGMEYDVVGDIWIVIGAKPKDVIGNLEGGAKCKARTVTVRFEGAFKDAMQFVADGFSCCVKAWSVADYGDNASSGNYAQIGSSGNGAQIGSSGNDARIGSSGNGARIGSSGNYAQIGSSGNDARIGSSGNDAKIGSSGYGARIGSSGNYAKIGSSGNGAKIGSSGNGAKIGSSGNDARITSSGTDSVVAIAGKNCSVRVGERGAFAIPYWDEETGWEFLTGKVGRDGILANTWYTVEGGKLVVNQELMEPAK